MSAEALYFALVFAATALVVILITAVVEWMERTA